MSTNSDIFTDYLFKVILLKTSIIGHGYTNLCELVQSGKGYYERDDHPTQIVMTEGI